jgi:hypothetical protein
LRFLRRHYPQCCSTIEQRLTLKRWLRYFCGTHQTSIGLFCGQKLVRLVQRF